LFEGGFEVFDDFLGENIGIGKAVGVFEAFIPSAKHYTGINFFPGGFKIAIICS
jgi:hypothetical protein